MRTAAVPAGYQSYCQDAICRGKARRSPPAAGSTTPGPAQQTGKSSLVTNHNKPSTRHRRPLLPRLPEDDRKVVVTSSNLNLCMTTPGQLLKATWEQLNLPPQETFAKDRLRINPNNNTFTISTPVKRTNRCLLEPARVCNEQPRVPSHGVLSPRRQFVRLVISGALGNETPDEILHYCITENPELPIVNARPHGRSRAAVITFEGTKPPKEMIFQAGLFTCHPFKRTGSKHVSTVAGSDTEPTCATDRKAKRCHRCGEELRPPPEEGEPPSCEAKCIICERPHVTGSRNCKHRFVEKRKKLQASDGRSALPALVGRRRQPRAALKIQNTVVAPTPQRKSVEEPVYFLPTVDDRGRNSSRSKSNERKKPPSSRGNSTTQNADKQVSWASRVSQANAGKREFLEQTRKLKEETAALRRRLDELEKLVKTGPNSTPLNTPAAARSAPPTPTQIATNNAMDADANRGTLKRQASTDLDANAKRVAEESPDGEPQPKPKTTVTSQAPMRKDERFDQLRKDNQETKGSLRLVGETLQQILQRLTALDRLAALEATDTKVQHTLVEIPPRKKGDGNVYVLNVCSSPKDRTKATSDIIRDFNAHHPAWGYRKAHIKGTTLWQSIQDVGMTILNDVKEPARIGNSVSTDTAPDLALSKNINSATWTNTGLTLGSDHYIVETTFQTASFKHPPLKTRLTDWDNFCKIRDKTAPKEIGNLNEWTRALKEDVKATTEETEATTSQHTTDPKLKHIWEARFSIQLRWKKQKHNRTLRKRVTQLERKIEAYAFELERQQWGQVCDSVNGHLGKKNTWLLLRHLLNPTQTKTAQRNSLDQIVHQHEGDTEDLIKELKDRYLNTTQSTDPLPWYEGLVISRMTYALPYLQLYNAEKLKIEGLIRQAYKAALGLPINTSTYKLLQLGLHNTLDELTEAHRRMQELRLARTNAGRAVLRRLGINAAPLNAGTRKIPSNVRKTITVKPLPKNMHPVHHEGRRRARAQALAKKL
ncbi:hypothetical protein HPB47_027726 [Ixodes persulcatus]|uniref:Uncharacterized protein n=1 Tax=Ixodes persulcatus TaxID=34615 RepID=A0AC60PVA8_IXOPE|nr:hypothetical protein HPB47_027726 [Ixodes persulcatus]